MILFLLVISVAVHIPTLHLPLITIDAWRQTDEESVVYHFVHGHFNLLQPAFFYDGAGPQQVQLELQVVPFLTACLMNVFGWHTFLLHVVPSALFTLNVWLMYLVGKRLVNPRIGLLASTFYLLIPDDIYYGQALMPEVFMMTTMLAATLAFMYWSNNPSWPRALVATAAMTLMLLAKLPAASALLGLAAIVVMRCGWKRLFSFQALVAVCISFGLTYIYTTYEGLHAAHTFISGDTHAYLLRHLSQVGQPQKYGQALVFLFTNATGYGVTVAAVIGLLWPVPTQGRRDPASAITSDALATRQYKRFAACWALGAFLFVAWVATNNALHYYYIVMTIPASLLAAYAIDRMWSARRRGFCIVTFAISIATVGFCIYATPPFYTQAEAAMYRLGQNFETTLPTTSHIIWVGPDPMMFDYAKHSGWRWLNGDSTADFASWLQARRGQGPLVIVVEHPSSYPHISTLLQAKFPSVQQDGYVVYEYR